MARRWSAPGQHGSSQDPTHADLLAMAHAVRAAVIDDDTEQMHVLLCRLRADLVTHLRRERPQLPDVRGSVRVLVADGQHQLIELIDEVMLGIGNDPDDCTCLVRAVEIEIALRRQAQLEARVLRRQPLASSERT